MSAASSHSITTDSTHPDIEKPAELDKKKTTKICTSEERLEEIKRELEDTEYRLKKTKKKLRRCEEDNEELIREVDDLKRELRRRRRYPRTTDRECQTDEIDYSAWYTSAVSQHYSVSNGQDFTATTEQNADEPMSIADELRHAAEQTVKSQGYEYDEASKLYYDKKTGYYYDPENSLHYDGNSGTYYTYDEATDQYIFHSQVDLSQYKEYYKHQERKKEREEREARREARKRERDLERVAQKARKRVRRYSSDSSSAREEGELNSDSNPASETENVPELLWRPSCVRAIVLQSELLTPGSLYLITVDGGIIGREDSSHNVITLPDPLISKEHCKITYSSSEKAYYLHDCGSNNGTYLNSERVSENKTEGTVKLNHRDSLWLGSSTEFLIHIHPGTDTCDDCEPGKVTIRLQQYAAAEAAAQKAAETPQSKTDKQKERKAELKKLKKKYGLENERYVDQEVSANPDYEDKAERRRKVKGSDNPYIPDEMPASVDRALASSNKGHKLLQKMGWKAGDSLGKSQQGIAEPVQVGIRLDTAAGLGSANDSKISMDAGAHAPKARKRTEVMMKTKQRYESAAMLGMDGSDVSENR